MVLLFYCYIVLFVSLPPPFGLPQVKCKTFVVEVCDQKHTLMSGSGGFALGSVEVDISENYKGRAGEQFEKTFDLNDRGRVTIRGGYDEIKGN